MRRILLFISLLAWAACTPASKVPQPDPGDPGTVTDDEEAVSIAYLKTLYNGAPVKITRELRISGIVISNDIDGNFYKTLVLDDGTGGIELKLDLEEVFRHFTTYSTVDVHCNGLWLGSYGGTLQLGAEPYEDLQTQYIPEGEIPLHCLSDGIVKSEFVPRKLTFGGILPRHISTLACFDSVQFIDEESGRNWAETGSDADMGTDRHLVDASGDTLTVRTSRYAAFAYKNLPGGNGYIEGVLGYFNGSWQLVLCDDQKAEMENQRFSLSLHP